MSCSRPAVLRLLLASLLVPAAALEGQVIVDLVVAKADSPDPVVAGETITYTITLTNNGPDPATDVSLTDGVPAQATYVSFTAPVGWTLTSEPNVGETGTVIATTPLFGVGSAEFTLVVRANPNLGSGAIITNTVSSNSPNDPQPASDTEQTSVITRADLVVSKTDSPDPVVAGTDLTYTLTLTNEGPSDAQNVTLSDTVPTGTTFVSSSQTSGPAFTLTDPPGPTGTFSATITTLAAGASATFTLVVRVDPGVPGATTITNTASAASVVTTDPDTTDDSDTETTGVVADAELALTKTDSPDPVAAGAELTYTLTLANAGPSDATSVVLSDVLPLETTFVSVTQTSGPAFTLFPPVVGNHGTFTAMASPFAAGAEAVFALVVRVDGLTPPGTSIENEALVQASNADSVFASTTTTTSAREDVPPIPTLSEWMLLLLTVALAATAIRRL